MFFYLSKIFWFVMNPANIMAIIFLIGMVLLWVGRDKAGKRVLTFFTVLALVFSTVPIGKWFSLTLEERFPQVKTLPEKVDGIIVLGGAVNPVMSQKRGQLTVFSNFERVFAFDELSERYPDAKLVYTGGSGSLTEQEFKEADFAREALQKLGMDINRVIFENQSRNTYENAVLSKALVSPLPDETWVLITSAHHMPRAVGVFRKADWHVLPYPVDYSYPPDYELSLMFSYNYGLKSLGWALHEAIGLVAYWATDKSSEIFPGPVPN